jgi:hypothetical protein
MKRRVWLAAIVAGAAFVAVGLTASAAGAYGSAAQWQIAISMNCNNASLCGGGGGGFWGWAEFDNNNTGDAEFTGCGHLIPAHGDAGAGHISIDVMGWYIAPGSAGPQTFYVVSETDTSYGHGSPTSETFLNENMDTGVPAVPGHYSLAQQAFGFTGPGVSFQLQVVKIPGK